MAAKSASTTRASRRIDTNVTGAWHLCQYRKQHVEARPKAGAPRALSTNRNSICRLLPYEQKDCTGTDALAIGEFIPQRKPTFETMEIQEKHEGEAKEEYLSHHFGQASLI